MPGRSCVRVGSGSDNEREHAGAAVTARRPAAAYLRAPSRCHCHTYFYIWPRHSFSHTSFSLPIGLLRQRGQHSKELILVHACVYIITMYSAKQVTGCVTMNIDIPKNANRCIKKERA